MNKGFYTTYDLYSVGDSGVSYGVSSVVETLVAENVDCRFTTLTTRDEQKWSGQGDKRIEKIFSDVVSGLSEDASYVLKHGSDEYDVLFFKYQRDENGTIQHLSLIGEKR